MARLISRELSSAAGSDTSADYDDLTAAPQELSPELAQKRYFDQLNAQGQAAPQIFSDKHMKYKLKEKSNG